MRNNESVILEQILRNYRDRSVKSRKLWNEAIACMPSGSTRSSVFYAPYPSYAKKASGSQIEDVDGNRRIDYCYNFTSLIMGHQHPAVTKAIRNQLENGTVFGAPTELEVIHSSTLKSRMRSLDKVRYTVSGTEACMFAVRLARAFTNKKKIAKFEGGYHGTSDFASVSVHPNSPGTVKKIAAVVDTAGLLPEIVENTIVMPFNDFDTTSSIVRKYRNSLACIIVEPIMRGISPLRDFLPSMRELADELDIPLVFDEVITGFRISPGGAQEKYRVRPDLTVMGKIIGGGFPIGAIGGREDIMSMMAQGSEFPRPSGSKVPHAGTFNAHPITLAAGLATLKELTADVYKELDQSAEEIRTSLTKIISDLGVNVQCTGVGSLFDVVFTGKRIIDYKSHHTGNLLLRRCFDLDLLNRGVFMPPTHFGCTSAVTKHEEIDTSLQAMKDTLTLLLPLARNKK